MGGVTQGDWGGQGEQGEQSHPFQKLQIFLRVRNAVYGDICVFPGRRACSPLSPLSPLGSGLLAGYLGGKAATKAEFPANVQAPST